MTRRVGSKTWLIGVLSISAIATLKVREKNRGWR